MRLDQPVSYEITTMRLRRLRPRRGTGFHLNIGGKNEQPLDYWTTEAPVRVDLVRPMPHDGERRLALDFPHRMSSRDVPHGIFDSGAFVEDLNCDVGLLFSMLSAPHATIEVARVKRDKLAEITLTIGKYYASKLTLPMSELKPFLGKA